MLIRLVSIFSLFLIFLTSFVRADAPAACEDKALRLISSVDAAFSEVQSADHENDDVDVEVFSSSQSEPVNGSVSVSIKVYASHLNDVGAYWNNVYVVNLTNTAEGCAIDTYEFRGASSAGSGEAR